MAETPMKHPDSRERNSPTRHERGCARAYPGEDNEHWQVGPTRELTGTTQAPDVVTEPARRGYANENGQVGPAREPVSRAARTTHLSGDDADRRVRPLAPEAP